MSMHFAPQWVKPIKPTGTALTPSSDVPPPMQPKTTTAPSNVPFPALAQNQRSASPNTSTSVNPPLSYSRVTHTPLSPGSQTDSSYFPYAGDGSNGNGGINPHPFRYSREQILALYDDEKVKERPIELVQMLEAESVLASKTVGRPVGLRDLTEIEKKLFATSIHPPAPSRRQNLNNSNSTNDKSGSAAPIRRTVAPPVRDAAQPSGRSGAFGGFGRGEGGAFGGGVIGGKSMGGIGGGAIIGNTAEGKLPGSLGSGFGGVGAGKRLSRRLDGPEAVITNENPRASGATSWRHSTRSASGTFEGVLGFGNMNSNIPAPVSAPAPTSPTSPSTGTGIETQPQRWRDKLQDGQKVDVVREKEAEPVISFGNGGGPGWGTGQRKWRTAAAAESGREVSKTLDIPISTNEEMSESVVATAAGTPQPERDQSVQDDTSSPAQTGGGHESIQEKEDLGAVKWFYRDPEGQEQGPFLATQMHDWYSHAYFTDDLPVRRETENAFHTLSEVKAETGNAVQPFLSPIRPRNLPPNLPIPFTALQAFPSDTLSSPMSSNNFNDSFRNLALQNQQQSPAHTFPQQYTPDRAAPFAAHNPIPSPYAPPHPGYPVAGQGWNGLQAHPQAQPSVMPRMNGNFGVPSPIGSAPLAFQQSQQSIYSPVIGGPMQQRPGNDFYIPTTGGGNIPVSPWSVPQPPHTAPIYQQQQHQQLQQPPPAWQIQPISQLQQPQLERPAEPHPAEANQSQTEESQLAADEPSYFPPTEDFQQEESPVVVTDEQLQPEPAMEVEVKENVTEPELPPKKGGPPPSVWGTIPSTGSAPASRKSSIIAPVTPSTPAKAAPIPSSNTTATAASTGTTTSKLPPAHSSLPPKPITHITTSTSFSEPVQSDSKIATPSKGATAPWAAKEEDKSRLTPSGPSLREIQEAEAKQADARKSALAETRLSASSPQNTSTEDFPSSMAWGLPSSVTSKQSQPQQTNGTSGTGISSGPSTPSIPVWGGDSASAPKKTLKQIQEEEEKRKAKIAAAQKALQAANGVAAGPKRGYADLAATSQTPSPAAGWSTVGAGGKASTPGPVPVPRPASVTAKPITPARPAASVTVIKPAQPKIKEDVGPSADFLRWTKQALNGLTGVNMDEFIQMLLTFPINPPASQKAETLQIISESVYENSSTLDGRRFAQEFFDRRKNDALNRVNGTNGKIGTPNGVGNGSVRVGRTSLADVVKTLPKSSSSADLGFKVVKAKGKKK